MLAKYGEIEGKTKITAQIGSELLDFFENKVIPECENFIKIAKASVTTLGAKIPIKNGNFRMFNHTNMATSIGMIKKPIEKEFSAMLL